MGCWADRHECAGPLPGAHPAARSAEATPVSAALELSHLGKSFGALMAVRDVSLEIAEGERRVILGTNGAGKSTLFNLIAGDIAPSSGSMRYFGQDITRLPSYRRSRIGVSRTYQSSRVLRGLTVLDNLYVAVRGVQQNRFSVVPSRKGDTHIARARELAGEVGLAGRTSVLANELSHGEQRQLDIGMALAGAPRLLLLDEPAAGLSPAERPQLTSMLRELPRSMTVVLIEHDMDVALQVADRVTVMNEGAVVFEGSSQETAQSALVQALYLGTMGRDDAADPRP